MDHRKKLFEKLCFGDTPEFDRDRFYGVAVKVFRMMYHEITPENVHDGGSFIGLAKIGVDTVKENKIIGAWAKMKNLVGIIFPVGMFEKILRFFRDPLPFIKHFFSVIFFIKNPGRFTKGSSEVVENDESSRSESMDRDGIGVLKPKRNGGFGLPPSSVKLRDGDSGELHKPNVLAHPTPDLRASVDRGLMVRMLHGFQLHGGSGVGCSALFAACCV